MKLGKYETSSDEEGAQPSKQWGERTSGHGAGVEDRCERHSGAHRALGVLLCSIVSGGPNTELRQMVLPSFYR